MATKPAEGTKDDTQWSIHSADNWIAHNQIRVPLQDCDHSTLVTPSRLEGKMDSLRKGKRRAYTPTRKPRWGYVARMRTGLWWPHSVVHLLSANDQANSALG